MTGEIRYGVPGSRRPIITRLMHAQRGRCAYCPARLTTSINGGGWTKSPHRATVDHVWPRKVMAAALARFARYGRTGTLGNAVAACQACNVRKGNAPPTGCALVTLEWVNARLSSQPVIRTVRK